MSLHTVFNIKPAGNEIVAFCDAVSRHYESLVSAYREASAGIQDPHDLRDIEYKHHDAVRTFLNTVNNAFDTHVMSFTFDYSFLYQTDYRRVFEHKSVDFMVDYVFRGMITDIEQRFVERSHGTHYGQLFWRDMRGQYIKRQPTLV